MKSNRDPTLMLPESSGVSSMSGSTSQLPGPFERYTGNPILGPSGEGWEAKDVFNPAAWTDGKTVSLLYRAEDHQGLAGRELTSRLGLARSADGFRFERHPRPVMEATEPYEMPGGCEDPRLVCIEGHFYLTYTAYDGQTARLCMAEGDSLDQWTKRGPLFPQRGWTKSGAILDQPINGRYWMYFGDTDVWAAHSVDLRCWEVVEPPVLSPRPGRFDARLVEPGPPPRLMPQGIWLIYNSADGALRYAVGQALFAPDDPTRLLRRDDQPLLEPTTSDEIEGQVPRVVFAEGLVPFQGRWLLYYGMADSRIGVAVADG
jgi:beta-1,2-mannosidase